MVQLYIIFKELFSRERRGGREREKRKRKGPSDQEQSKPTAGWGCEEIRRWDVSRQLKTCHQFSAFSVDLWSADSKFASSRAVGKSLPLNPSGKSNPNSNLYPFGFSENLYSNECTLPIPRLAPAGFPSCFCLWGQDLMWAYVDSCHSHLPSLGPLLLDLPIPPGWN